MENGTTADGLAEFVKRLAPYNGAPRIGARYWETRDLGLAEIAKRVRQDIKALVLAKRIPPQKYSVRIERGGHGYQAINVRTPWPRSNAAGVKLQLKYVLDQYNYDASSPMDDHHRVRFGASAEFEGFL